MDREDFEWGIKGPALPLFILSIVIFLDYSALEDFILTFVLGAQRKISEF